jgi:predicted metal-dependent peptidase
MQIRVSELLNEKKVAQQEKRWLRAIRGLEDVVPFWAYHAERLNLTMCRGWNTTAAVDGTNLFWNPEFTSTLTDKQLTFLLVHEVFHVAAGHLWRGQRYFKGLTGADLHREASLWNQAADYAIHQVLVPLIDSGHYADMEFIKSGLYDPKYARQSAETIRDQLKVELDKQTAKGPGEPGDGAPGAPGSSGSGQKVLDVHIMRGDGDAPEGAIEGDDGSWVLIVDQDGNPVIPDKDDPKPEPKDTKRLRREIKREVDDAQLEKEGGSGNGVGHGRGGRGTVSKVDPAAQSKQSWDVLKRFILQCAESDYSYAKPNRSYLARGMILPGLRSGALKIKIAIDTSSSINKPLLSRFASEVEGIRSQLGDHEIELITCSSYIPMGPDKQEKTQVVRTGEDVNWNITIGGGTDFRPVFDYVSKQGDSPACLLYFTDLEGDFPKNAPDYPVLWAVPDRCYLKAPFGETLSLTVV